MSEEVSGTTCMLTVILQQVGTCVVEPLSRAGKELAGQPGRGNDVRDFLFRWVHTRTQPAIEDDVGWLTTYLGLAGGGRIRLFCYLNCVE
jgi:hypothetical protein